MVEVPEHLLRRSRERREALGLAPKGGAEEGGAAAAPAEEGAAEEGAAAPAAAAAQAPAPARAPAPAAEPEPPKPPPPPPPYVQAALRRKKIPMWVTPVLLALPVWALIYAGVLATEEGPTDPVLAQGQEIYASECAVCHGAQGQGGTGYPLADGSVLETFPDREAHIEWVMIGTQGVGAGNPYGSPDRSDGQRIAGDLGVMPSFEGLLTEEEILAVVRYEREVLSGEAAAEGEAGGEEGDGGESGEPGETGGGEGEADTNPEGGGDTTSGG